MFQLSDIGRLAFASRLKSLSESLHNGVDQAYKDAGFVFQSRWFPVIITLKHASEGMSIGEIAKVIGQSHPSVSQITKQLLEKEIIVSSPDPRDERRRIVKLSDKGQSLTKELGHFWISVRAAIDEIFKELGVDLLQTTEKLEKMLEKKPIEQFIIEKHETLSKSEVEIITFDPKYSKDFERLNVAWLEKFFYVEDCDLKTLKNPQKIVDDGGEVYFAKYGDDIVGTVALMVDDNNGYELTKMAVSEDFQGLKIGKKLFLAAIEGYQKSDKTSLFLFSNKTLVPAITLYERYGFDHKPMPDGVEYERANVYMEYNPDKSPI